MRIYVCAATPDDSVAISSPSIRFIALCPLCVCVHIIQREINFMGVQREMPERLLDFVHYGGINLAVRHAFEFTFAAAV